MLKRPFDGRPGGVYWYVLQTHAAAEIGFNRYVKLFPKEARIYLWEKKPNESERTVFLTGGRQVSFKAGQNFDDLRIETLDGAIIDECRQQDKRLWTQVMRPMLGRRRGWCDFYSTPNGYDWFYDLADYAKSHAGEWELIKAPSSEAWWWTPEEIESARASMSEGEFAQEIGADFRDLTTGKAYTSFTDANKTRECPWMPGKLICPYDPLILGADFNLSPMHWSLGQMNGKRWWWFDEIHLKESHTLEAAIELRDKIFVIKQNGFRGTPTLRIVGDATGKATQRASNQSDYDIIKEVLRDAKIEFVDDTPESNPPVRDRVNAVNAKCKNARGEVQLWVHEENCEKLIYDFERVTWKEGGDFTLNPGKDRMLTHATDSIGYPIHLLTPVSSGDRIGKMRIISRVA